MAGQCHCGGTMTEGFIPDHADMGATWVSVFVGGQPKSRESFWQKFRKGHGVAPWEEDDVWALTAQRCESCGRVELFAKERPDPELMARKPG